MKHLTLALLVASAAAALPAIAHAAPPVITDSQPRGLVSYPDGPGSYQTITVYGSNLALPSTTGYTLATDVTRYALWDGAWHVAGDGWLSTAGWNTSSMGFQVPPLRHGGNLILAVCTRGESCATWTVPVRDPIAAVPVFRDASYRRPVIDPSVPSTDYRRLMRVRVDNLDNYEYTQFWGLSTSVAYMNAYESVIDLWVRDNIAGHYNFWVKNRAGWSNAVGVDLIDRPALSTMTPAQVTSVPSTVTLAFRDAYTAPDSTSARLDVPGCASQTVSLTATSATTFAFTMPATCRVWYASYDATLVVQNIAGSSNITIPVRPVTVTSPGGGGFPGGWPH
ncbi:MAG: hypothetical protein JNK64_18175 [Myxococcales bacterium]|nr:hypothetical protein [Myxococcales bacterium]